jgi:hypothetical protein
MMDEAWSWNKAERQAADIMGDLASWVVAWLDWNLLVDENGGPSHMGWNCGAAIVTDHTNRHGRGTVVLQPSYYYTGHFSRWVEPGMAVVQTTVELNDAVKNVQSGEWGLMDSDRVAMFPYVSISPNPPLLSTQPSVPASVLCGVLFTLLALHQACLSSHFRVIGAGSFTALPSPVIPPIVGATAAHGSGGS